MLECTGTGAGPVQHPVQHELKFVGKSHLDLILEVLIPSEILASTRLQKGVFPLGREQD